MNGNISIAFIVLILTTAGYCSWNRYQCAQDYARIHQTSLQAILAIRDIALRERPTKHYSD